MKILLIINPDQGFFVLACHINEAEKESSIADVRTFFDASFLSTQQESCYDVAPRRPDVNDLLL